MEGDNAADLVLLKLRVGFVFAVKLCWDKQCSVLKRLLLFLRITECVFCSFGFFASCFLVYAGEEVENCTNGEGPKGNRKMDR